VTGYPHSVWQIVEHMNYWMEYDLGKVRGESRPYPDKAVDSWREPPNLATDEQWGNTIRCFTNLLACLAQYAEWDEESLEQKIQHLGPGQSARESTLRAMLWQIAAHNSYHAGQIALLRRQFGAWPPRLGGDSW